MDRWPASCDAWIWPHLSRFPDTRQARFSSAGDSEVAIADSVGNAFECAKRADLYLHGDGRSFRKFGSGQRRILARIVFFSLCQIRTKSMRIFCRVKKSSAPSGSSNAALSTFVCNLNRRSHPSGRRRSAEVRECLSGGEENPSYCDHVVEAGRR